MGRLRQIATAIAALAVLMAVFLAQGSSKAASAGTQEVDIAPVPGKNGTVLFFINTEYGLSNVHLATASALLERHPGVDVHIASFPRVAGKIASVAESVQRKTGNTARAIHFHELPGPEYAEALSDRMGGHGRKSVRHLLHPPGVRGYNQILRSIQPALCPWNGSEHVALYERATEIITNINPSLVVLDIAMRPAFDAARQNNRFYAMLAPNSLSDMFWAEQPYGAMFWKYTRIGCDFPFPLPWWRIPENIYVTIRFFYAIITRPGFKETRATLAANGIEDSLLIPRRADRPWIAQNLPEATLPLTVMPPNVTATSPIVFDPEPAVNQDPELVAWLARGPTVLINLGSLFAYSEQHATVMALAIRRLAEARPDLQFLWKLMRDENFTDDYVLPAQDLVDAGRLRVVSWLAVGPVSLFDTGHIVTSVHHGGANCYNEAVLAGVPQIVLPMWLDCYNYAQLAEDVGVGIYASRASAPDWTVDGLADAFFRVLGGGEEARQLTEKAKAVGESARREPGRYVAAQEIARLASFGEA